VLLLIGYWLVSCGVVSTVDAFGATTVLMLVADSAIYLLYVWLVLRFFKRPRRFLQTASALIGVDTLFALLSIPLLAWQRTLEAGGTEASVPVFLYLVLFLWSIDVAGYVLSRALQRPYIEGVLIVILYVMASFSVRYAIDPVLA
jgi:hypothetical protein